jgi:GTPase SAR1 family protein
MWYENFDIQKRKNIYLFLGTKIDLREDGEYVNQLEKQNLQPIKREQGQRLCKKIRAFKYVECSALTQKGLKQVRLFFHSYFLLLSI